MGVKFAKINGGTYKGCVYIYKDILIGGRCSYFCCAHSF